MAVQNDNVVGNDDNDNDVSCPSTQKAGKPRKKTTLRPLLAAPNDGSAPRLKGSSKRNVASVKCEGSPQSVQVAGLEATMTSVLQGEGSSVSAGGVISNHSENLSTNSDRPLTAARRPSVRSKGKNGGGCSSSSRDKEQGATGEEATTITTTPASGKQQGQAKPARKARTRTRRAPTTRKKATKPGSIPRPPNSWILYRSVRSKEHVGERSEWLHGCPTPPPAPMPNPACYKKCGPGTTVMNMSKMLADMWKRETRESKDYWRALAELKSKEHQEKYPNYRYTPKQSKARLQMSNKKSDAKPPVSELASCSKAVQRSKTKNECRPELLTDTAEPQGDVAVPTQPSTEGKTGTPSAERQQLNLTQDEEDRFASEWDALLKKMGDRPLTASLLEGMDLIEPLLPSSQPTATTSQQTLETPQAPATPPKNCSLTRSTPFKCPNEQPEGSEGTHQKSRQAASAPAARTMFDLGNLTKTAENRTTKTPKHRRSSATRPTRTKSQTRTACPKGKKVDVKDVPLPKPPDHDLQSHNAGKRAKIGSVGGPWAVLPATPSTYRESNAEIAESPFSAGWTTGMTTPSTAIFSPWSDSVLSPVQTRQAGAADGAPDFSAPLPDLDQAIRDAEAFLIKLQTDDPFPPATSVESAMDPTLDPEWFSSSFVGPSSSDAPKQVADALPYTADAMLEQILFPHHSIATITNTAHDGTMRWPDVPLDMAQWMSCVPTPLSNETQRTVLTFQIPSHPTPDSDSWFPASFDAAPLFGLDGGTSAGQLQEQGLSKDEGQTQELRDVLNFEPLTTEDQLLLMTSIQGQPRSEEPSGPFREPQTTV